MVISTIIPVSFAFRTGPQEFKTSRDSIRLDKAFDLYPKSEDNIGEDLELGRRPAGT